MGNAIKTGGGGVNKVKNAVTLLAKSKLGSGEIEANTFVKKSITATGISQNIPNSYSSLINDYVFDYIILDDSHFLKVVHDVSASTCYLSLDIFVNGSYTEGTRIAISSNNSTTKPRFIKNNGNIFLIYPSKNSSNQNILQYCKCIVSNNEVTVGESSTLNNISNYYNITNIFVEDNKLYVFTFEYSYLGYIKEYDINENTLTYYYSYSFPVESDPAYNVAKVDANQYCLGYFNSTSATIYVKAMTKGDKTLSIGTQLYIPSNKSIFNENDHIFMSYTSHYVYFHGDIYSSNYSFGWYNLYININNGVNIMSYKSSIQRDRSSYSFIQFDKTCIIYRLMTSVTINNKSVQVNELYTLNYCSVGISDSIDTGQYILASVITIPDTKFFIVLNNYVLIFSSMLYILDIRNIISMPIDASPNAVTTVKTNETSYKKIQVLA